jgi:hypothetical protein
LAHQYCHPPLGSPRWQVKLHAQGWQDNVECFAQWLQLSQLLRLQLSHLHRFMWICRDCKVGWLHMEQFLDIDWLYMELFLVMPA